MIMQITKETNKKPYRITFSILNVATDREPVLVGVLAYFISQHAHILPGIHKHIFCDSDSKHNLSEHLHN